MTERPQILILQNAVHLSRPGLESICPLPRIIVAAHFIFICFHTCGRTEERINSRFEEDIKLLSVPCKMFTHFLCIPKASGY